MSHTDEGGDPPCWLHLFFDEEESPVEPDAAPVGPQASVPADAPGGTGDSPPLGPVSNMPSGPPRPETD